jgi:hypothetical protein
MPDRHVRRNLDHLTSDRKGARIRSLRLKKDSRQKTNGQPGSGRPSGKENMLGGQGAAGKRAFSAFKGQNKGR